MRINGLEPQIIHRGEAAGRARALAWVDALERASHFAKLAGRELGPVLHVTEAQDLGVPVPMLRQAAYSSEVALPLEVGETTVATSITATWQLG